MYRYFFCGLCLFVGACMAEPDRVDRIQSTVAHKHQRSFSEDVLVKGEAGRFIHVIASASKADLGPKSLVWVFECRNSPKPIEVTVRMHGAYGVLQRSVRVENEETAALSLPFDEVGWGNWELIAVYKTADPSPKATPPSPKPLDSEFRGPYRRLRAKYA